MDNNGVGSQPNDSTLAVRVLIHAPRRSIWPQALFRIVLGAYAGWALAELWWHPEHKYALWIGLSGGLILGYTVFMMFWTRRRMARAQVELERSLGILESILSNKRHHE